MSEVSGQMSEVSGQTSEVSGQTSRSAVRRQRSAVRRQRSDVRHQRSEVGGQSSVVRQSLLVICYWLLERSRIEPRIAGDDLRGQRYSRFTIHSVRGANLVVMRSPDG